MDFISFLHTEEEHTDGRKPSEIPGFAGPPEPV